jgi:hypothetical protein
MSIHDRLDREGNAVASQATIAVGQMRVGEEGYCPVDAVYAAPSSSTGPDGARGVASTSHFIDPDAELYSEPSPWAKLHIWRQEDGFVIRLPSGYVPSRYLAQPSPESLPVVAIE